MCTVEVPARIATVRIVEASARMAVQIVQAHANNVCMEAQVQLCMTQNTLHGGANTEGANGGGTNRYASCGCVSFNAIDKHNSKRQSATSFENRKMHNWWVRDYQILFGMSEVNVFLL